MLFASKQHEKIISDSQPSSPGVFARPCLCSCVETVLGNAKESGCIFCMKHTINIYSSLLSISIFKFAVYF